jgi:glutathione S-transferase
MSLPVVFGAAYSVYVRAVRLTLEEKAVAYRLEPVDVFAPGGPPDSHFARHPFDKIPTFEHDGFRLYEAGAITRYVDEAFDGPSLQPGDLQLRARMNQAIGVLDSYAYRTLVWDIFVERVRAPANGRTSDEAKIAAALPQADVCLAALEDIAGDGSHLAGPALSLADLHALPILAYFSEAAEGAALLDRRPRLRDWLDMMQARPSFAATAPNR